MTELREKLARAAITLLDEMYVEDAIAFLKEFDVSYEEMLELGYEIDKDI